MAKTLLITLAFPPAIGGMQTFAYMRCRAQADKVTILAPQVQGWESFDARVSLRIYRSSSFLSRVPVVRRLSQSLLPLFQAERLYLSEGFDVIECWQPLPFGLIGLIFKVLYGIPYIVWSHGNDLSRPLRYPLGRRLLKLVMASAQLVVANSENTKQALLAIGTSSGKIRVLNPPVDTQRFRPDIAPSAITQKYDLEGKRVILTVARLVRVKGIDTVIKALPGVLEAVPNAIYLVVGDGPLRAELGQLAEALEVNDRVVFVGAVDHLSDDLPRYYRACDVFVMTSRPLPQGRKMERFGMVYLEAGACGKPVVAGRSGGVEEAVEDGVTGLLVDPLDVNEIAGAIVRVLENEELARRLGENGRKRAAKQPDWDLLKLTSRGCGGFSGK
ncbi:MAG: glycosyltransferase family 4 protein [Chloroflexi bacterium]|nr:glycosyltransferase family 4 protein [Chloroflexota bacterium]